MDDAHERRHLPGELPADVFDSLVDRANRVVGRAAVRGIGMSVSLQNGFTFKREVSDFDVVHLGLQLPVPAAGQVRLALAANHLGPGIGTEELIETLEVIKDRERTEGTAEVLTTTGESLVTFTHLLHVAYEMDRHLPRSKRDRYNLVCRTLAQSDGPHGVRNRLGQHADGAVLLNATAHDEDRHNRHDVGLVFSNRRGKRRLVYSVITASPTIAKDRRAEALTRKLGSEFISSIGGTPRIALGGSMGKHTRS